MQRYYFDYAAATPVDPRAEKAMRPYWSEIYGNPGALHWFGQQASAAIFAARQKAAEILGCGYQEIIFTSGATEANNLALRGIFRGIRNKELGIRNPKIIVSAIEHESILETARELEENGVEVVYLPVGKNGVVDLKKLKESLDERTILVSVMFANNEIGTIQPISEISKIIKDFKNPNSSFPLFHTDAVQAFNYLDCDVNALGVDLMTLSSQKIYGPKGVGLLCVRRIMNNELGIRNKTQNKNSIIPNSQFLIHPLITGGGQEFGLRGGTENVPAIAGFVKALEIASRRRAEEAKKMKTLQEYFWRKIKTIAPKVQLNGDLKNRLPNNLNLYFPGQAGQDLLIKLDLAGFAVSHGAACSARVCQPSHALKALGCSDAQATGSLRITFGRPTKKADVDKLLGALKGLML